MVIVLAGVSGSTRPMAVSERSRCRPKAASRAACPSSVSGLPNTSAASSSDAAHAAMTAGRVRAMWPSAVNFEVHQVAERLDPDLAIADPVAPPSKIDAQAHRRGDTEAGDKIPARRRVPVEWIERKSDGKG